MSSPSVLHGRRLNHWALSVRPLHGPPGLLWLSADDKLLGLDPVSGARRIEQPLKPASGDRYAVATDRWPQRVREVGAPPSLGATLVDGAVRVARGDEEVARVSVPTGFGSTSHLKVDDDVAWLFHEPSRGAVKMRIARLDLESRAFDAPHELGFSTFEMGIGAGRVALFHGARGEVHVYGPGGLVGVVKHVPSAMWGHVALDGVRVAVVSHQRGSQPGAVAAVGYAEVRAGEEPTVRRFAVRTQGASDVTFVDGALALHQYGDVTLIATDDLSAAPAGELSLVIEDVPTAAPGPAATARVTFFGASTGFGFAESKEHGRLRFQADAATPVAVGDEIVIDAVDANAIRRWHRPSSGAQPLAPQSRCFEPAAWSDFLELVPAPADPTRPARPRLPRPDAAYCASVWYGAELTDPDDGDEPVEEPEALRALEGTIERTGELLDYLADDELDIDAELVAVRPTLRYLEDPGALRLALEFYTRRLPTDAELAGFASAAERLLDSGWGVNYEFDPPRGYQGCVVRLDYRRHGTTLRHLDE